MIAIGIVVIVLSAVIITIQLKILSKKDNEEERYYLEQQFSRLLARQDALNSKINDDFRRIAQYLNDNSMQNEQKLENIRKTLSYSIARMSEENTRHLDSIRNTVDEKLQDTLDKKLNESFKIVSERLEQVYKGLGEMQNIASSVGDLKKVLSNVKTRGVLGEVQLGAIIEQILSPEQYERNVATKKGSQANVEYAVKLPGDEYGPVWLPIDAKFPADAYANVVDAYESGDAAMIDFALRQLKDRLRSFAKDISTKYVSPPDTTDFAIMFLPFEGLYSEAVRMGMVEILQNEYKINIAGPTTMAALLNSLQMGFKTLAIQKRSGEVWNVLGAVKNEFDTFASVLESAQHRINQANDDLDKLIGVRTRKIQRTLKDVESTAYEIKSAEEE
ncbi:MAG: DNA recombination protein RmuC [Clostridia bacterium]|nr:DNA recombination protein RmuC [Clostridia bacterium]